MSGPVEVTDEEIARVGRVWGSATLDQREAMVWLGFGYHTPGVTSGWRWNDLGPRVRRDIARGVKEFSAALRHSGRTRRRRA